MFTLLSTVTSDKRQWGVISDDLSSNQSNSRFQNSESDWDMRTALSLLMTTEEWTKMATPRKLYFLKDVCAICGFSFIQKQKMSDRSEKLMKHSNKNCVSKRISWSWSRMFWKTILASLIRRFFAINSHTWWQTVQIQIRSQLDLHCLQRQGISGLSRTKVNFTSLFVLSHWAKQGWQLWLFWCMFPHFSTQVQSS